MDLQNFQSDNFLQSIRTLFKNLSIPINCISDEPTTLQEILGNAYEENLTFQLVEDLYFVGMVDDAAFMGNESPDIQSIESDYDGILIFGITLKERDNGLLPTRTQLAEITRAFNRRYYYTPVMVVFKYNKYISIANVERSKYKRDNMEGEKVGRVSLLRDIDTSNTHVGHKKILDSLRISSEIGNFASLYQYWRKVLDVSLLNKRFYEELSHWYFWAMGKVSFPDDVQKDKEIRNSTSLIRLITRIIFAWFIKEKELLPTHLFMEKEMTKLLKKFNENETSNTYYPAILQNLFFATLNQKREKRKFADNGNFHENRDHYGVKDIFRYASYFSCSKAEIIHQFDEIPYLNGGLFECLDVTNDDGKVIYQDGFSRNPKKQAMVPDFLFFSNPRDVDLNKVYETSKVNYKVRGLINILSSYIFTVTENTPLEEDVALDPELLGKVFENLLASYNPETKSTARKQTGSFYTPREIVDYMVDESLKDHIRTHFSNKGKDFEGKLNLLFSYGMAHSFLSDEIDTLLGILNSCRIFDPACGSGAFPMGILQRMVFLLHKLDPDNENWKQQQIDRVTNETKKAYQNGDSKLRDEKLEQIKESFDENINFPDYARKLYLIENSIYGSDIQPIAIQICKLRFFISLVIEQKKRNNLDNFGIRALPNLETKFVCANSLVQLDGRVSDLLIQENGLSALEEELRIIRHNHFAPQNRRQKLDIQKKDKEIRDRMAELIQKIVEQKNQGLEQQIRDLKNRQKYGPLSSIEKGLLKRLRVMADNKLDGMETSRLLTEWKPYDSNGTAPFFDLEWMFGLKDGFDIIIGNPPYIQLQKDGGKLADLYANKEFSTFVRSGDIYCLFYERGINLINENGTLCYITSNKWMKAKYGEELRKFFLKHGQVKTLIDFGDAHLFENATICTNILLYRNKNSTSHKTIVDLSGKVDLTGTIYDLLNKVESGISDFSSSRFLINNQSDAFIKKRIEELGVPLKDWDVNIYRGVLTGFNEAFIIDTEIRDRLVAEDPKSAEIIKPILRGRDIKRYQVDWKGLWLIDTHNGYSTKTTNIPPIDIQQYPGIKNHLDQYTFELERRGDKGITPYNLRSCAYEEEFAKEKIIWAEIVYNSAFSLDTTGIYPEATTFILTGNSLRYLTGMLNSKLLTYCFRNYYAGGDLIGKSFRYKKSFLEYLPIPRIPKEDQEPFNELLDYIQFAHKHEIKDPTGSVSVAPYFEEVMDLLVAGVLFREELQKAECFINNDLLAFLPSLDAFPEGEEKINHASQTYKSLSTEPLIESSRMRYKLIEELKPVFGG